MQIAFLVCVAASHLPFSLFLCSRYRVFFPKRCVAARNMAFGRYLCSRHMLFCQKWCVAALHLCFSLFLCSRYRVFFPKRCVAARCMFSAVIHVRDTGFSARKGVSLRGTWRSVFIYVCDTCFSVKKCVSLRCICVFSASVSYGTWFCGRNGVSVRV